MSKEKKDIVNKRLEHTDIAFKAILKRLPKMTDPRYISNAIRLLNDVLDVEIECIQEKQQLQMKSRGR